MDRFLDRSRGMRALVATLWLGSVLAALPGAASAITIVEWDVVGATGQTASPLALALFVSASDIASSGVTDWTSTAWTGFLAARGWGSAASEDPAKFYELSVTADPGHEIAYQTISLALFRGVSGPNHGADLWSLHASTDGFATSDLTLLDASVLDISGSAADEIVPFLDQDISALGSLPGTVTFRLYGFDYTAVNDYSGLGADPTGGAPLTGTGSDVVIQGQVVPEPATAVLLALGLAALALRRGTPRTAR